jgi:aryl carrier-like protein
MDPRFLAEFSRAWCQALNVSSSQSGDHFFDLGGDSIAGLRLIAALRSEGLVLHLQELYENPVLGQAASLVRPAEQAAVVAPRLLRRLPLLPIQVRTLRDYTVNPHHNNDDVVYALPTGAAVDDVVRALSHVVDQHDALRSRFCLTPGHEYQEVGHELGIEEVVRTEEVAPADTALVAELGVRAHRSLDARLGRLLAARILIWQNKPWALIMVVNHLVCDAMSWDVLACDLFRLLAGGDVDRSSSVRATASYATWVDFLSQQCAGPAFADHLAYWRGRPWSEVAALGLAQGGADRKMADLRTARAVIGLGDGLGFRQAVSSFGSEALVLGALNYALKKERQASTTLVDVLSNGRNEVPGAPDVSRTVGWFADIIPVVTDVAAASDAAEVIGATARQLRAVPAPRTAFGCFRYLTPDASVRDEFEQLPHAEVRLNYRGSLLNPVTSSLRQLDYSLGPFQCQDERQAFPLRVVCDVAASKLVTQWKFLPSELAESDVTRMAEAFSAGLCSVTGATRLEGY